MPGFTSRPARLDRASSPPFSPQVRTCDRGVRPTSLKEGRRARFTPLFAPHVPLFRTSGAPRYSRCPARPRQVRGSADGGEWQVQQSRARRLTASQLLYPPPAMPVSPKGNASSTTFRTVPSGRRIAPPLRHGARWRLHTPSCGATHAHWRGLASSFTAYSLRPVPAVVCGVWFGKRASGVPNGETEVFGSGKGPLVYQMGE